MRGVFLDRDGTIIVEKKYISKPEEVETLKNASLAIKMLNQMNFKVIIITNQSGIARGYFTVDDFNAVNKEMQKLLEKSGAKIDAIYLCPHLPEGTVPQYSIDCDCRKPKPGLLIKAALDLGIEIEKSFMIGDDFCDILAGKNAGAKTILVLTGYGKEVSKDCKKVGYADYVASDLLSAACWIKTQCN